MSQTPFPHRGVAVEPAVVIAAFRPAWRGALWAALALGSVGAQATTLNTAQLSVRPSFFGGTGPYSGLANQNGPASLAGSATGGADSSGAGTAYVNWGVVKMTGEAAGSLDTVARGIFRDELVFTAPNVPNGTLVTIGYSLVVEGLLFTGDPGVARASWSLRADMDGFRGGVWDDISGSGRQDSPANGGQYTGTPFGTLIGIANVRTGVASQLFVQLEAAAQAAYTGQRPGRASASFDLGHSLYWGGINSVTINGVPVPDFSVSSASGTDYRNSLAPIPEPGALAMMLAGLGVLIGLQRRRRR